MNSFTWYNYDPEPPAVNIFKKGRWRAIAIIRLSTYLLSRSLGLHFIFILCLTAVIYVDMICVSASKLFTQKGPETFLGGVMVTPGELLVSLLGFLFRKWWRSKFTACMWWTLAACFLDGHYFSTLFADAWSKKIGQNGSCIHVFVDEDHFEALLPGNHEAIAEADDAKTLEFLRMWYCDYQLRRGIGELFLTKKLSRINRVKVSCF